MLLNKKQIESILKGLRNGLEYGSKVRFVHSLVMTLLFRSVTLENLPLNIQNIIKMAIQHGKNLGLFVLGYKTIYKILDKLWGKKSINHLIAGFIFGGYIFGNKSSVNQQIVLYLLSRVLMGLISFIYKKVHFQRWKHTKQPIPIQKTIGNYLLAAICWGIVMCLFQTHPNSLQISLKNSMTFLYIESDFFASITDLIPYWPKPKTINQIGNQAKSEQKGPNSKIHNG